MGPLTGRWLPGGLIDPNTPPELAMGAPPERFFASHWSWPVPTRLSANGGGDAVSLVRVGRGRRGVRHALLCGGAPPFATRPSRSPSTCSGSSLAAVDIVAWMVREQGTTSSTSNTVFQLTVDQGVWNVSSFRDAIYALPHSTHHSAD